MLIQQCQEILRNPLFGRVHVRVWERDYTVLYYSMACNLSSMPACVVNANEFSRKRMYFENHPRELGGARMCMWRCCTRRNGGQWKPSRTSSGSPPCSVSTCRAISPILSTMGMWSHVSTPGFLHVYNQERMTADPYLRSHIDTRLICLNLMWTLGIRR